MAEPANAMTIARTRADREAAGTDEPLGVGLAASWPLIALSAALFVGAVVAFAWAPHLGPGGFPLWGLLITLGFIAGIGGTISWFFATGARAHRSQSPPRTADATVAPGHSADMGRPVPEVRRGEARTAAGAAWDEADPPSLSVAPRTARPTPPGTLAPEEVDRALDEIDRIEEQLARRTEPKRRRSDTSERS